MQHLGHVKLISCLALPARMQKNPRRFEPFYPKISASILFITDKKRTLFMYFNFNYFLF